VWKLGENWAEKRMFSIGGAVGEDWTLKGERFKEFGKIVRKGGLVLVLRMFLYIGKEIRYPGSKKRTNGGRERTF